MSLPVVALTLGLVLVVVVVVEVVVVVVAAAAMMGVAAVDIGATGA